MKKKILTFILTAFVVVNTSHYAFAGILDEECTECSKTQDEDGYWEDLLSAELHNWRILREIPTVFESDSWKTYYALGPAIPNIDPSNIDEKSQDKLTKAYEARKKLVELEHPSDFRWYIWGDSMPVMEEEINFSANDFDEEGFRPFLLPYLLENPEEAKGNLIVIAGGGYQSRANSGEGYPIAETFRNLGYNCFVLQRRVFPYGKEDIWMDLQRSLRYLKYHAEDFGFDSVVHYEAVGFSGGSGTVLGTVQSLYGDIQPTIYDPDYICDEIDTVNADFDAVLAMYGPNMNNESDYKGMITENENLPDFFIAVGQNDMYGAAPDCLILANSLAEQVRMEFHYFADAPHGFSLGIGNNNSAYWVPMADAFLDRIED